jgi:type IV secretory pathway protease TraF
MSRTITVGVCAISFGFVTLVPAWSGHRLLMQPSASLPRGVYWQRPVQRLAVGLLVSADLAPEARTFAAARGYLRAGLPVLKPVAAVPGETVCWRDDVLTIDGRVAGPIVPLDRLGRLLPRPYGCVVLRDAVLLLSTYSAFSWDGRYFGLTPLKAIRGEAALLWSWDASRSWPHASGRKDGDCAVAETENVAGWRAPGAGARGRRTSCVPRPARHAMTRLALWTGARE